MSACVVARPGQPCYNAINRARSFDWLGSFISTDKEVPMKRYQVWLDGQSLHNIDPSIRILDVQEHTPATRLDAVPRAMGDGLHATHSHREALRVTVTFVIREPKPLRRKSTMQKIRAWAQAGGMMQLNDRAGQRLSVEAEALPSIQSALKWTEPCTVTFIARAVPYWEESFPVETTATALTPPGDAPTCPVDLRWTSQHSGAITLSVETPLSRVVFSGMPVSPGQELLIAHLQGVLVATLDGQDVLSYRTPESSDDLLITCGRRNSISVTVDGEAATGYTLSARGRWL